MLRPHFFALLVSVSTVLSVRAAPFVVFDAGQELPAAPSFTTSDEFAPVPTDPGGRPGSGPAKPVQADLTRFLIVGGGTSPFNTQASIEEHLIEFHNLLKKNGVLPEQALVLFADGNSDSPVVEVLESHPIESPLLNELALFMDKTSNRNVTWRAPLIPQPDGEASRSRLKMALEATGPTTRTMLYFAGHGYQTAKSGDVSLGLWGQERLTPRDLARWLDKLPPEHRVITVLTQCHAGGFAEYLYRGGDSKNDVDPHDRCGFYASPADYVASGCTPEANRSQPDDYSTWFIAALARRMPNQGPLPDDPDLDKDGRVSFSEAHAFARIHDGTIDIPVASSEYFLRRTWEGLETVDTIPTLASTFPTILSLARPTERKVMTALAASLGCRDDPAAAVKARYEADRLALQRDLLNERAEDLQRKQAEARNAIRDRLLERWPWLVNPYHPRSLEVQTREQAVILEFLAQIPERQEFDRIQREWLSLRARVREIEKMRTVRLAWASNRAVAVVAGAPRRAQGHTD